MGRVRNVWWATIQVDNFAVLNNTHPRDFLMNAQRQQGLAATIGMAAVFAVASWGQTATTELADSKAIPIISVVARSSHFIANQSDGILIGSNTGTRLELGKDKANGAVQLLGIWHPPYSAISLDANAPISFKADGSFTRSDGQSGKWRQANTCFLCEWSTGNTSFSIPLSEIRQAHRSARAYEAETPLAGKGH